MREAIQNSELDQQKQKESLASESDLEAKREQTSSRNVED